jgi:tetratricopeptide (TPR) repeat protein
VALKRKKVRPNVLTAWVAFFIATVWVQVAGASPTGLDAIPPAIETLYSAGSYSQGADALQAAIVQHPKDASLYYWLGRCYFEIRDFDRSISSWESAIDLDSTRSDYHDWLGRAYGRKAEQDSHSKMASALSLARRTHHQFEVAVQLDATNLDAQRDLIAFMASAPSNLGGGEEHALEQIRALSAVDPLEGMLALADLYATRKKLDQASEEYQKILKSSPDRVAAYFEIADYYRDRGDSEHMKQAVEGALRVAPSDRRLNYYRGVALVLEKKDSETAERDLRTYIDSVPDNSELPAHSSAYEWLGKLYENEKKPNLAAEQYKAALILDPQNKALREALKRLPKK